MKGELEHSKETAPC